MATPLHPLTKPHLDKLAGLAESVGAPGPEEIERRAQELLHEWLKFYFSGTAFTTPTAGGGAATTMHFESCEILWDHATPPLPAAKPVLHTVLADRRDGDPIRVGPNVWKIKGEWTWNTFVRTHPQLPASDAAADPAHDAARFTAFRVARRVGDQFAWLLRGPHTQELAFKGIKNLRLTNGPRPIQSGAWFLRQIIFTANVTFTITGNDP